MIDTFCCFRNSIIRAGNTRWGLASREDRLDFIKTDEAFHLAIARIGGNRILLAFLQTLWRMLRPAKLNLMLSAENRGCTDREHQELFQSIVEGDADKARAAMRAHIGKGRSLLLEYARTLPRAGSEPGETKACPATRNRA